MVRFAFKNLVGISVFLSYYVAAFSMDELKQIFVNVILECSPGYEVTEADLEQLKYKQMPDKESVKCLFACIYKKAGMMDDQGKLSVEGVHQVTQKYLYEDPDQMEATKQFTEACTSVNDVDVNDGEKGCERAALIFQCSVENAPQYNLPV